MLDDFPIGSVVRLKSGGPEMTVVYWMPFSHEVPPQDRLEVAKTLRRINCVWCDYASDDNVIRRWSGDPECIVLVRDK